MLIIVVKKKSGRMSEIVETQRFKKSQDESDSEDGDWSADGMDYMGTTSEIPRFAMCCGSDCETLLIAPSIWFGLNTAGGAPDLLFCNSCSEKMEALAGNYTNTII